MSVYMVTWNLNKEHANYTAARTAFIKQLDSYSNKADSGLESVRFLQTDQTADQVSNFLCQNLDSNDRLLVSKMNVGQNQGWLLNETWEWINSRL